MDKTQMTFTLDAGIGNIEYQTPNLDLQYVMELLQSRIKGNGLPAVIKGLEKGLKEISAENARLQEEIDDLEKEKEDLQEEVDKLEEQLEEIENDRFEAAIKIDTGSDTIYVGFDKGNLADVMKCEDFAAKMQLPNSIPQLSIL